jgi:class 3 adenylate cyclase/tetratricopeptide (TPR) repeat protein
MTIVRKTVTVLFCDLVGSTAMGDRSDPELLREAMSRYHAELRRILERHGGTVEKFVGDAAMAVFGIPQVHEDDALRAVRAAAEILGAVAALELEVRIGINTGEVVAGEGETLVTGDAVNVAARLEQAAASGEILLGDATEALVRGAVRAESVEPLELKGKSEPVPAYRLLEILADGPAFTRPIEAPFVGREQELQTLEQALMTATETRQPQLATVAGPPGIGKSRLTSELIQRSDARVLVGRCLSYGEGITYWPLAEVARQVGDISSAVADELVVRRIDAALGGGEATADEIALAFRKLFEALARQRPLIFVVDDIHWAEPTLLDLIEYLAAFAADAPLFLLCSTRPDLFDQRPQWATRKPNATLVTLEPLPEEQTQTLVDELDELGELGGEARARIVAAAEGNPLFVEQLVAHQTDSGNGKLEIPPTIHALLAARIDLLEPAERSVIERASIEGRLFHRGSVQALLPEPDRTAVGSHLLTLVRKEFVRPDRAELPDDDGFRFGHILIREAAYDSIPKRLRAELHERFADWFESRLGDDAPAEILGYHLEQAHRYRVELGQDDEYARELALRAGRLLGDAGRRADARGDAASTVCALLARAVELLPEDEEERPRLLSLLGEATVDAGDPKAAIEILRRAQRAAAAAGQRGIEIRARMRELWALLKIRAPEDAKQQLDEAQAAVVEAEGLGHAEALVDAWHMVSEIANLQGDMELCAEASEHRLVAARRAGRSRQAVWAANWVIGAIAEGPTPVRVAIRRSEEVRASFEDELPAESNYGLLQAYAGRLAEGEESIKRARKVYLERSQQGYYAASSANLATVALLSGRPAQAEEPLREAIQILEDAGQHAGVAGIAAMLAEVLYRLGQDSEAEEWTRRIDRLGAQADPWLQAISHSTRAKVMARRGEVQSAEVATEAVEWANQTDMLALRGDCLAARGETLQLLGRTEEARAAYEEALAVYEHKGIVPSIERTQTALAELGPAG